MSPESIGPQRPDARKSADRKIFREIDAKVAIVTDVWRTAMILPIPLASDVPEIIEAENRVLNGVLARSEIRMPDAFSAHTSYLLVTEMIGQTSPDEIERLAVLQEEADQLKETRNFEFAETMVLGISRLIARRKVLRDLQREIGEPRYDGFYEDPGVLSKATGITFAREEITRAVMGAYSVSLFVIPESYERKFDKTHPDTNGVHLAKPAHVSVLKDYLSYAINNGTVNKQDIMGLMYQTLLHEEFHGFADAFTTRSTYFTSLKEKLLKTASLLTDAISEGEFRDAEDLTKKIREMLRDVPGSSTEELLAEMAATNERGGSMPKSTFAVHNGEKGKLLDAMESSVATVDVRRSAGKLIENSSFRKRMGSVYELADSRIPERRQDLDALFVVIPPNKIFKIWATVVRWIWERDNQITH